MISEKIIQNISLFMGLQLQTLSSIVQDSRLAYYKKGTILDDAINNEHDYFYYIKRGWIKLFSVSFEGVEIVKDLLTDNHYFNESLLFNKNKILWNAQAVTDVQVILTPISHLKKWLHKDAKLVINLLEGSLYKQRELTCEIEHLSIQTAAQRIGCFLLRLCPINYSYNINLNLPCDKFLLAARLGMRPETFSRALATLSKKCHIKINGEIININNIKSLTDYVCKHCSLAYPCQSRIK